MEPIILLDSSKAVLTYLEKEGFDRSEIERIIITCDIILQSLKNK